MRTESIYMMIAIGLALSEEVNKVVGNGINRTKISVKNGRLGPDAAHNAGLHGYDSRYLEKFATQFEIIPLMSKLI